MYTLFFAGKQYKASQVKVKFIEGQLSFYGQDNDYLFSLENIEQLFTIDFTTESDVGTIDVYPPQVGSSLSGLVPYDIIVDVKCETAPIFGIVTTYIEKGRMITIIR